MAEGETRRPRGIGTPGKWGVLLLLAAVLSAGLLALPTPATPSAQSPSARRDLTTIQTLAGPRSQTHTSGASGADGASLASEDAPPTSPYAELTPGDAPKIYAYAAYLIDPHTGEVFYSKNALNEVAMASTTKIMTAIVALTFGKPDQKITIGQDAVAEQNGENSVAFLTGGDTLTLKDLLYALLLPSGDDAAVAIADGVAGSQTSFVRLMNMEAALLGLDHTHYTNVHGLDADGHYTTVGDLARIAGIAMENFPVFAEIVKTPVYTVTTSRHGQYTWYTTNELLTSFAYKGVIGVKTGHTGNAGFCLVFAATRDGSTLVGVLLGEQDETGEQRFRDATALLSWGFAREQTITRWFNAIAGRSAGQ